MPNDVKGRTEGDQWARIGHRQINSERGVLLTEGLARFTLKFAAADESAHREVGRANDKRYPRHF